jgi:hypothetical protein
MPRKIPHDVALRATLRGILRDAMNLGISNESYGFHEHTKALRVLFERAYLAADVPVACLRRRRSVPPRRPSRGSGRSSTSPAASNTRRATIRASGHATYNRRDVTCKGCMRTLARADEWAARGDKP